MPAVPENPLAPRSDVFIEPWYAETLALADAMVRAGHFSAADWAAALGAALSKAAAEGHRDDEATYYAAALTALEALVPLTTAELASRKTAWARAYADTPHGQPVHLGPVDRDQSGNSGP